MMYRAVAYPRAALVGNPSDGYHGKTIAFVFSNFAAEALLYETPELELLPAVRDNNVFSDLDALADDVNTYGYYGGIRLLKAAVKKFRDYCFDHDIQLEKKNFSLRYRSTIPNRLGLAGSSAIITAAMRAILEFYHVRMEPAELANLVLSAERDELNIPAGLQDRVAQAWNNPVYMDFDAEYMKKHGVGRYRSIELPRELNLYVAYRTDLAEGSEVLHSKLREEYEAGVPQVRAAMVEWAALTDQVKAALDAHDFKAVGPLLDRNFDLRCEVCSGSISEKNREMVKLARSTGASAKFTGSGGAIIGTYPDEKGYKKLVQVLGEHNIDVIRPKIVTGGNTR